MLRPSVSFIVPFRVYMPENFYEVKVDNRLFSVKPQTQPPLKTAKEIEVHGPNVEFSHDIFGYAGRTLFHVILDYQIDISTEEGKRDFAERDKVFVKDAIVAVNRLLEVYRDQDRNELNEESFHIIPIVITDTSDIRIVLVKDDLSEEKGICIRILRLGTIGFGPATKRPDGVINGIITLLKDGTKIPIYRELLSSSKNAIWRGQYRLCPVESNTAFEAFVSEIIILLDPSVSLSSYKDLFSKLVLLESILNKRLSLKSLPVVSWFRLPKDGLKSIVESVLVEWKTKCYELRKRVIHEGYSQVTFSEATSAHEAAINAIRYIQCIIRKII